MFIERDFEQDDVFDESCDGAIIYIEAAGKYGLYKIRKKPGQQYYLIEA